MVRVLIYLSELLIIGAAVFLGRELSEQFTIIPKWLFRFPEVWFSDSDFATVLIYFLVVHATVFGLSALMMGNGVFRDPTRSAKELCILIAGFSVSSLALFLLTDVGFSPELLAASAVSAFVLFIIASLIGSRQEGGAILARLGALAGHFLKQFIRPLGIFALLLAASPMVLAKLYISDRDVANMVTRVRIYVNAPDTGDYALIDAWPGLRFRQAMIVQHSPGDGVPYVLERHGRIYSVTDGGQAATKDLVLDFADRVGVVDVENGALGFDFHTEFGREASANTGYVYVYYTAVGADTQVNRISRFDLSLPDLESRSASEQILIAQERDTSGFHNGGSVEFGEDGFLYFAIGEATSRANWQRLDKSLFGGIFRVDVDLKGGDVSHSPLRQPDNAVTAGYYIPNDNPFVGQPGVNEEYWALGLRNPFRFSFDRASGEIWVGDVGSTRIEEVNIAQAGGNYQFPYIEGVDETGEARPTDPAGRETGPVHFYEHTAYERSVIGGSVYRGTELAALRGKYIFADNYSGNLFAIEARDEFQSKSILIARAEQVAQQGVTSLTLSPKGDLLVTTLGRSGAETGRVLKLVPAAMAEGMADTGGDVGEPALSAAEIAEAYNSYCGRCHGSDGRGDGPDAAELAAEMGRPLPDFTTRAYQASRSDEELARIIRKGGEEAGLSPFMPPWEDILSDQEVDALIEYVRSLHKHGSGR